MHWEKKKQQKQPQQKTTVAQFFSLKVRKLTKIKQNKMTLY